MSLVRDSNRGQLDSTQQLRELHGVIRRLAEALDDFGATHAIPDRIIGRFALASDELVTNTIAFNGLNLHIEVVTHLLIGRLSMTTEDNGRPFDPFSVPPPDLASALEDRAAGGLGVPTVTNLMDDLCYLCHNGLHSTTIAKIVTEQDATA